jgi:hypothetical protein
MQRYLAGKYTSSLETDAIPKTSTSNNTFDSGGCCGHYVDVSEKQSWRDINKVYDNTEQQYKSTIRCGGERRRPAGIQTVERVGSMHRAEGNPNSEAKGEGGAVTCF